MKTHITSFLAMFTLTITTVYGQTIEPLDLAKKIFGKDSFPNIANYISGEYKGKPNGQDLLESTTKFILLEQKENTAVVGMTILDSIDTGLDTYLYFKKDTIWKMTAIRALAMTGIIEQAKIGLEKMTSQQVDEIIAQSKNKEEVLVLFTSREEYNFKLGNAKLILELDDNIIKHFKSNKAEFERLKNLALAQLEKEKVNNESSAKLIENYKTDYQKLFITFVSSGDHDCRNCINFVIGGMVDNTVGYIYVKDKIDLPEMNQEQYIMIREIGNGWYIYKTT